MILEYKNYKGTVESMQRIGETSKYNIFMKDADDVIINFQCDIHDVKIPNVMANHYLFES